MDGESVPDLAQREREFSERLEGEGIRDWSFHHHVWELDHALLHVRVAKEDQSGRGFAFTTLLMGLGDDEDENDVIINEKQFGPYVCKYDNGRVGAVERVVNIEQEDEPYWMKDAPNWTTGVSETKCIVRSSQNNYNDHSGLERNYAEFCRQMVCLLAWMSDADRQSLRNLDMQRQNHGRRRVGSQELQPGDFEQSKDETFILWFCDILNGDGRPIIPYVKGEFKKENGETEKLTWADYRTWQQSLPEDAQGVYWTFEDE